MFSYICDSANDDSRKRQASGTQNIHYKQQSFMHLLITKHQNVSLSNH